MNKQTKEQLQSIVDLAPDGATHYNIKGEYKYLKLTYACGYQAFTETTKNVINTMPDKMYGIRSLSDIKTILALTKELEEVKETIESKGENVDVVGLLTEYGKHHSMMKILRTEPDVDKWLDENLGNFINQIKE